jgi:hypothetical protein
MGTRIGIPQPGNATPAYAPPPGQQPPLGLINPVGAGGSSPSTVGMSNPFALGGRPYGNYIPQNGATPAPAPVPMPVQAPIGGVPPIPATPVPAPQLRPQGGYGGAISNALRRRV